MSKGRSSKEQEREKVKKMENPLPKTKHCQQSCQWRAGSCQERERATTIAALISVVSVWAQKIFPTDPPVIHTLARITLVVALIVTMA